MTCDSGRHPQGENSRSEVEGEACQSGGKAVSPNLDSTTPTTGEDDVERPTVTQEMVEAADTYWRSKAYYKDDQLFSLPGTFNWHELLNAALAAMSPTTEDAEKRELVEALREVRKICEQDALPSSTQVARIWARLSLVKGFALAAQEPSS